MTRLLAISCAAVAVAAAPVAAQAAQLLVNGGFEGAPAETNIPLPHSTRGAGPPEGWSSLPGYENPDILNAGYSQGGPPFMVLLGPHSGSRFLDTNGASPTGGLFQDVTGLEVGSTVTLSFWVGQWAQNSSGVLNMYLLDGVTQAVLNSQSISYPVNSSATTSSWAMSSFTGVVGASGAVRVQFTADSGSVARGGIGLDDVALDGTLASAPVPEPSAWALMIAGFGLAGAAMRRRAGFRTRHPA
jgi:hypothetical protein